MDFELELIHRDEINVNYIIQLLIQLKFDAQKDVDQVEKEISRVLSSESTLRSKKELIEKFIQENLPDIHTSDDLSEEFEQFWNNEQQKAFEQLVKDEVLSEERTQKLIENYLYAEQEPLLDEILELIEGAQPSVLKRKKIGARILKRIKGFVDTFIDGMDTN